MLANRKQTEEEMVFRLALGFWGRPIKYRLVLHHNVVKSMDLETGRGLLILIVEYLSYDCLSYHSHVLILRGLLRLQILVALYIWPLGVYLPFATWEIGSRMCFLH